MKRRFSVEIHLVLDVKMLSKASSVSLLERYVWEQTEVLGNRETLRVRRLCLDLTQINESHGKSDDASNVECIRMPFLSLVAVAVGGISRSYPSI